MMDWFRSHHGAPTDPKWQLIARRAKVPTCAVVALFWQLLDYASQHSDRGSVAGFDLEVAEFYLGLDEGQGAAILSALTDRCVIVGDRLANWDKRQPKRERDDNSTGRVQALRARQKPAPLPSAEIIAESVVSENATPQADDVTPCNATKRHETQGNAVERLDKTRLDKTRLDKRQTTDRQTQEIAQGNQPGSKVVGRSSSFEEVKEKVSGLKGLAYLQGVLAELPTWTRHLTVAFTAANERSQAEKGKPIANPLRWKCQVLENWLNCDGTPEDEPEAPPALTTPKAPALSPLASNPDFKRWKAIRGKSGAASAASSVAGGVS